MSRIINEKFTCTNCHVESDFKMYKSVNVSLDPELKDKVISGEIFKWTCPNCGETLYIHYDLLYHDMENEFMIYYSPNNCEQLNKDVANSCRNLKGMQRKIYRTVDSMNRLIEKINILEEGLNDIAIEFGKLMLKVDKNNEIPNDCDLYFERCITVKGEDNKQLLFRLFKEEKLQKEMVVIQSDAYNNYLDYVSKDNRFALHSLCDTINEKWIMNKFKSM